MSPSRDQLSLFVDGPAADTLNALRARLDPVQAGLIPAHVTVCREDELQDLPALGTDALRARLHGHPPLTLRFGPPQRFGGHGVLLPCVAGQSALDELRRCLLGRESVRPQAAHLTLAHPRNPRAPGNGDRLEDAAPVHALCLADLRWIRQSDGGPWQTIARFSLGPGPR